MSSFIGHSLAGLSAYTWKKPFALSKTTNLWLAWLIIMASAPDIDHWVPGLHIRSPLRQDLRITHSILLSLVLPIATAFLLYLLGVKGRNLILRSTQAILAGLSHILLDLLTGVNILPLLWPFSIEAFKLPFGILPSAGLLNLGNYFLYRNLLIESGVLAPIFSISYLISHKRNTTKFQKATICGLLFISICFMYWSFSLGR